MINQFIKILCNFFGSFQRTDMSSFQNDCLNRWRSWDIVFLAFKANALIFKEDINSFALSAPKITASSTCLISLLLNRLIGVFNLLMSNGFSFNEFLPNNAFRTNLLYSCQLLVILYFSSIPKCFNTLNALKVFHLLGSPEISMSKCV